MQKSSRQAPQPNTHRHAPPTSSSESEGDTHGGNQLTYYPAYCFNASETYSKWVKLTADDIHSALKPHEKYSSASTDARDGGLLLFYLNHPIQFVQIIGVVVVFEDYFEKFWLFTVDDSSGATIDVYCPKPEREGTAADTVKKAEPGNDGKNSTVMVGTAAPQTSISQDSEDPEILAARSLHATIKSLTIGTVVQAKGTITTFRSVRQLQLIRLAILHTTSHELNLISSRNLFLSTTLSKPWALSQRKQESLRQKAQGEHEGRNEKERRRKERKELIKQREERHAKQIKEKYEREEQEREKGAERARRAAEKMQMQNRTIKEL